MPKPEVAYYELCSQIVQSSGDLFETLNIVIGQLIANFGFHAGDFILYDPPSRSLRFVHSRGFHLPTFDRAPTRITALAGKIAQEEHALFIADLNKSVEQFPNIGLAQEGFIAYLGIPVKNGYDVEGVIELFARSALPMNAETQKLVEWLVGKFARSIHRGLENRRIERARLELIDTLDATIATMVRVLEQRERESEGHTARVAELTVQFGQALGVLEKDLVHLRRGALLHDIGKMSIPEEILLKPDALTETEWDTMRQHPKLAYDLLYPIEYLRPALSIPYAHHEKWDGTGYPRGLKGEDIPLPARLFAVVDVWDALRSERPFRQPWPEEKVMQHILDRGGRQFEQRLAEMFVKAMQAGSLQRKRQTGEDNTVRNYATQSINT